MKTLVDGFPVQLQKALEVASASTLTKKHDIQNIVVSGLGGSGIGGSILAETVLFDCIVPITINKNYFLPSFANKNTLVIISSYSGNTEETLHAMEMAINQKCQIVCITSGGQVAELAKQHNLDLIIIPGGQPPRSSAGYSLVQLFHIVQFNDLVKENYLAQISQSITLLNNSKKDIQQEAQIIAKKLTNKLPVIYSLGQTEGVVVRLRQQINENSKMLCWHHVLPEMNHNELVGWTEKNNNLIVIVFKTSFDYNRTEGRYQICKPIFEKFSSDVIEITAQGKTLLEQNIYLIHIGDWISCYIADNKNIDATEVNIINHLKESLSKLK